MKSILENDDIVREIVKFLPFENKIQFGKFCKMNFTKFYDFTKNISGICDVFYETYNGNGYLQDTRYTYIYDIPQEIYDGYIAIRKKEYFYDEINDDDENILLSDYSFTSLDNYSMKEECIEIFDKSFHSIYARLFIETIENNNLPLPPPNTIFDGSFNNCIFENVIMYYQTVFQNNNIKLFCEICGKFGHHNTCKSCLFYSPENEKIEIQKEVSKLLNELTTICQFIRN